VLGSFFAVLISALVTSLARRCLREPSLLNHVRKRAFLVPSMMKRSESEKLHSMSGCVAVAQYVDELEGALEGLLWKHKDIYI
jgi:hypothetical protein